MKVIHVSQRSPYKTPWRLWAEKKGLVLEQSLENNPLIRVGLECDKQWLMTR